MIWFLLGEFMGTKVRMNLVGITCLCALDLPGYAEDGMVKVRLNLYESDYEKFLKACDASGGFNGDPRIDKPDFKPRIKSGVVDGVHYSSNCLVNQRVLQSGAVWNNRLDSAYVLTMPYSGFKERGCPSDIEIDI